MRPSSGVKHFGYILLHDNWNQEKKSTRNESSHVGHILIHDIALRRNSRAMARESSPLASVSSSSWMRQSSGAADAVAGRCLDGTRGAGCRVDEEEEGRESDVGGHKPGYVHYGVLSCSGRPRSAFTTCISAATSLDCKFISS